MTQMGSVPKHVTLSAAMGFHLVSTKDPLVARTAMPMVEQRVPETLKGTQLEPEKAQTRESL